MKRIVVDTHALLASLLGGEARLVMEEWWEGRAELVLSEQIVAEYLAALARLGTSKEKARELLEAFAGRARGLRGKVVWAEAKPEAVADASSAEARPAESSALPRRPAVRPAVRKFIEAALAGGAEAIVALDPELVERGGWKGIPILTPGAWLQARVHQQTRRQSARRPSAPEPSASGRGADPPNGES